MIATKPLSETFGAEALDVARATRPERVLHRACHYEATSPRELHRATLVGDEPIR